MEFKTLPIQQVRILKYIYTHSNSSFNTGFHISRAIYSNYSSCFKNFIILKEKGLIRFEDKNKRSKRIFLTKKGKELVILCLKIGELINGS